MLIWDIILYEEDEETKEMTFYSYEGDCSVLCDDIDISECREIDDPRPPKKGNDQ